MSVLVLFGALLVGLFAWFHVEQCEHRSQLRREASELARLRRRQGAEHAADLRREAERLAAYHELSKRSGDFEVFRLMSEKTPSWAASLTPQQIANFRTEDYC